MIIGILLYKTKDLHFCRSFVFADRFSKSNQIYGSVELVG